MNSEIKRLLKLSNIPNFVLSEAEKKKLDDWKASQKPVSAPKKRRTRKKAPQSNTEAPEREEEPKTIEQPSKVQNIVKTDEKALNEE